MIDPRPVLNLINGHLRALPLLVVYLTDGCNSRCISCDIWKQPRRNMPLALAEQLASEFSALGVQAVLLSGGEATQHPQWLHIAEIFANTGAQVSLLTNGLLLKKQAHELSNHVSEVTVSLDAATSMTYEAIRGVDALDLVLDGIRAINELGIPVTTRTTVQRANYHQLPDIVRIGRDIGVQRVSFLAVDVTSSQAFGPRLLDEHGQPTLNLDRTDLEQFGLILDKMEQEFAAEFASGFIAESPAKLRRLHDYFAALLGAPVQKLERAHCNAPHISTVVEVDGSIRPCYFLPVAGQLLPGGSLREALNERELVSLRRAYRNGHRDECYGCVCPLYRGPRSLLKNSLVHSAINDANHPTI